MENAPAELATRVFSMVTYAHLEHFKTPSYARHMALQSLYEDLPDLIDKYIEHYQGEFGKITAYPALWAPNTKNIETPIKLLCDWITEQHEELTEGSLMLENDVADLHATLYEALYRLRELS